MLRLEQIELRRDDFTLSADLTLPEGITALLGPSGAGKSTLLDAIAGFAKPQAGRVVWNEGDITPLVPAKRPCAMLFQDNNLFPHLSVAGNLALACTKARASENDQIRHALKEVELAGFEDRKPAALSGGQQARVALARALLQDRPLLLLDEAFAALGPALKADMLDLVAEKASARGMHVVMVSHDPQDAARIAHHVCVVANGEVSRPERTDIVLAAPPKALRDYLGDSHR